MPEDKKIEQKEVQKIAKYQDLKMSLRDFRKRNPRQCQLWSEPRLPETLENTCVCYRSERQHYLEQQTSCARTSKIPRFMDKTELGSGPKSPVQDSLVYTCIQACWEPRVVA